MALFEIDEQKCRKDGICVTECPLFVIRQKDKDHCPEPVPGVESCFECGHCVAVCPYGAFNHKKVPLEFSPPILKENTINKKQAVQFLRSRRAIRHFKDKSIDKSVIKELIEIARYAPSGSNKQSVEWTVFSDKNNVKRIAELTADWMRSRVDRPPEEFPYLSFWLAVWDSGMDIILWDAPALVVASSPGDAKRRMANVAIALTYLELAAVPMGLGTCWVGLVQLAMLESKPLQEFIGLPDSHGCHYPMLLGYPKYKYHRMPERKPPKINWK